MIKVTVWNEYIHDRSGTAQSIYPKGIHGCIADFLNVHDDISAVTATLDEPECGLSEERLSDTDVLVWWGHCAHDRVPDEIVQRVVRHINGGMGLIALHSAHHSKVFRALCGTSCNLGWRNDDRERLWCSAPMHPIADGIPVSFELKHEEMYCEPFDIPSPDETIFLGWFGSGGVFRSGCTFTRGGRIFYFQPGHEEYPTYHNDYVRRIITNAVRYTAPVTKTRRNIPVVEMSGGVLK